jgi:hypothetical protein
MSRLIIFAKADKAPSGASSEIIQWKIFEAQVRSFLPRNPDLNLGLKEIFPDKLSDYTTVQNSLVTKAKYFHLS